MREEGFTNQVENLIQSTLTLLDQQKNLKQSIKEKETVSPPLLHNINKKIDKLNMAANKLEKDLLKKDETTSSLNDNPLYTQIQQAVEKSKQARKDKTTVSYKEKTKTTDSKEDSAQIPRQLKEALKTRRKRIKEFKDSHPEKVIDKNYSPESPFPLPCGSESDTIIKLRKQIQDALEERKRALDLGIDTE